MTYKPRDQFNIQLRWIKKIRKELRLLTCEVLRHDGKTAIEIGEMMGLSQRQVHYQWKLARSRGYYRVPTEALEDMARHYVDLYDEAAIGARDWIHKVHMHRLGYLAGYTTKV